MSQRWYVLQAYSGLENSVKRSLEERIERAGMEELFGEVMVPTEEVIEIRGGKSAVPSASSFLVTFSFAWS